MGRNISQKHIEELVDRLIRLMIKTGQIGPATPSKYSPKNLPSIAIDSAFSDGFYLTGYNGITAIKTGIFERPTEIGSSYVRSTWLGNGTKLPTQFSHSGSHMYSYVIPSLEFASGFAIDRLDVTTFDRKLICMDKNHKLTIPAKENPNGQIDLQYVFPHSLGNFNPIVYPGDFYNALAYRDFTTIFYSPVNIPSTGTSSITVTVYDHNCEFYLEPVSYSNGSQGISRTITDSNNNSYYLRNDFGYYILVAYVSNQTEADFLYNPRNLNGPWYMFTNVLQDDDIKAIVRPNNPETVTIQHTALGV